MVNIFIEAKDRKTSEAEFLTAILNRLGIPADTYSLKPTNGYTNLMDSDKAVNINAMRVNTDAGEKNLVVFDADSGNNNGGFEKRRDLLWRVSHAKTCTRNSLTVSVSTNAASRDEKMIMASNFTARLIVRGSYTPMLHRFPYPKRRKIKWEVAIGSGTIRKYGISILTH